MTTKFFQLLETTFGDDKALEKAWQLAAKNIELLVDSDLRFFCQLASIKYYGSMKRSEKLSALQPFFDKYQEKPTEKASKPRMKAYSKPKTKIAYAKKVSGLCDQLGIKEAAKKMGKSIVYVTRTYRAYNDVYLKNKKIRLAFDNKEISWTEIHRYCSKKVTPERAEAFAATI